MLAGGRAGTCSWRWLGGRACGAQRPRRSGRGRRRPRWPSRRRSAGQAAGPLGRRRRCRPGRALVAVGAVVGALAASVPSSPPSVPSSPPPGRRQPWVVRCSSGSERDLVARGRSSGHSGSGWGRPSGSRSQLEDPSVDLVADGTSRVDSRRRGRGRPRQAGSICRRSSIGGSRVDRVASRQSISPQGSDREGRRERLRSSWWSSAGR